MKKAKLIICIVAVMLMVLPTTLPAQQGGNIKFGNLSIIPVVEMQGIYDDNIFRGNGEEYQSAQTTREERKVSDWITSVKPGLLLNLSIPERGFINLGYQGNFAFYSSNTNNNWQNNQGTLDVYYQAPGGLIMGISDIYASVEDPYGNAAQYGIGRVSKRWTNDLKTKIGYNIMSNFRALLYYNNSKQQYNNILDYSQDYTGNEFGIGAEKRFLSKTWGFLRYHYGQRKYNTLGPTQISDANNADYRWSRISAGFTWDPGAKLSGEFNIGYHWLIYDHARTDTGFLREDKNTWIAETSVKFLPTETTTLQVTINRDVRHSGSDTHEHFTDTGIGFSVNQQLLWKLYLVGGISYSKNEYNLPVGNSRTDDNYLANIGLNYQIQDWIGVAIGYNYNQKNSNIETEKFIDNQFTTTLKIVY